MKKYIAMALLACASAVVCAADAPVSSSAPTLEGSYSCKGVEIDGKTPFTCDETIKQTGSTYRFTASCNDGTSYSGTGIYQPNSQSFSVAFKNDKNASEIGVALKTIDAQGNLIGQWTNLDKTDLGQTTCTKKTA